jgi:hypothetical protein
VVEATFPTSEYDPKPAAWVQAISSRGMVAKAIVTMPERFVRVSKTVLFNIYLVILAVTKWLFCNFATMFPAVILDSIRVIESGSTSNFKCKLRLDLAIVTQTITA